MIHTISCSDGNDGCAAKGKAYINLASDPKYKGQIEDLRTSNWSPLFDNILKAIQEKVKLTFALAQKPSDPATVGVYLNDKKLDTGWTYNAADNTITLEPGSAGADDKIVVVYTRD